MRVVVVVVMLMRGADAVVGVATAAGSSALRLGVIFSRSSV